MLILSRKKNETIVIGDVTITVCDVRGDKCKIGIHAPLDITVNRGEIQEAIDKKKGEL